MESLKVNQYARPLRIAFLVDRLSYTEGVKANTSLWGGIFNPLIPVKKSDSSKEKERNIRIIKDFDPDFIVNLTNKNIPYIQKAFPDEKYRLKRFLSKYEFYSKNQEGKYVLGCGLTVLPLIRTLWEKETKSLQGEESNAIILKKQDYKEWTNYLLFEFGNYLENHELDFLDTYKRLKPKEYVFDLEEFDEKDLFNKPSPIEITSYYLECMPHHGWTFSTHVIFVGDLKNWKDLVEFWNIRATGRHVLFFPFKYFTSFEKTTAAFIKESIYDINKVVKSSALITKTNSITFEQLQEVGQWINKISSQTMAIAPYNEFWTYRERILGGETIYSCELHNNSISENIILSDKKLTPFKYAKPTIVENSKAAFPRKVWANVINFSRIYSSKYSFTFPVDKNVEELVQRDVFIGGFETTRLSRDGIIHYPQFISEESTIIPIETFSVLEALFKSANMTISHSRSGILTSNVIEFLGGLDNCRVFKNRGVRAMFSEMEKKGALTVRRIKEIINRNWLKEYEEWALDSNARPPITTEKIFQHLVDTKLIKTGLEFECSQCRTKKWYGVNEFNEKFTCPYCFTEQSIPRLDTLEWKYKANGILALNDAGYGSLPVIISIWRLSQLHDFHNGQWHSSIDVIGIDDLKFKKEIDYLYLITDRSYDIELVLGEAKSHNNLARADFKKMRKIAKRFSFKPYLCFSTLKEEYNDFEKKEMNKLQKEGYKIIALTRQELDPYDLFDRFDKLKNKYAPSLEEFAENTRTLNLT